MVDLPSRKIKDIRGERFGRLLVESYSHTADNNGRNAYWSCKCDCGNTHVVSSGSLRSSTCISCGCYAKELSRESIKKTHLKGKNLYFIRSGPYIKIGRADKVVMRLRQLQAANPYDVELIHIVENAGHLEHSLHEKYKDKHHTGEWFFGISDEEVVSIGKVESDG